MVTAGKVTPLEVRRARERSDKLSANLRKARAELHQTLRRHWRLRCGQAVLDAVLAYRRSLDASVGRIGGMIIFCVACIAVTVICTRSFTAEPLNYVIPVASAALIAAALSVGLSVNPRDVSFEARSANLSREIVAIDQVVQSLRRRLDQIEYDHQLAADEYLRLLRILESRLHALLTCPWQGFAGLQFEQFLEQVFQENGYAVQLIGQSGDQGVDLVVTEKGRRIAVQAKGYPGSTVGNKAVQEVYTGMTIHDCHAAVVVTNSTFTRGAIEAATKTGCRLIDGSQIESLIKGQIRV